MVKIGLIQAQKYNPDNYQEIVKDKFQDIELLGNSYKKLFAFNQYIDGYDFDYVFNSEDELQAWLQDEQYPPLFKYFLMPVEIIPAVKQYAGFVYQSFPEFIFDYIKETDTVEVEGVEIQVPTNSIKLIPCNCTRWTDEGIMMLDAVIENWNVTYPNKVIDFQVKFETYKELKAFLEANK